jgi:uncharacterized protein (DUF952 family)
VIFHIVGRSDWDSVVARSLYEPPSLAAEGFIHCSTIAQIAHTANRHFRGQTGLVVLFIDESRLKAPLKYESPMAALNENENPDGLFPHLHGPLNLDAVVRVIDFPCRSDGTFDVGKSIEWLSGVTVAKP